MVEGYEPSHFVVVANEQDPKAFRTNNLSLASALFVQCFRFTITCLLLAQDMVNQI